MINYVRYPATIEPVFNLQGTSFSKDPIATSRVFALGVLDE